MCLRVSRLIVPTLHTAEYCYLAVSDNCKKAALYISLSILFLLINVDKVYTQTQCDGLVCTNNVQISLGIDCVYIPQPDDFLENPVILDEYIISFVDEYKNVIPVIDHTIAGQTLEYQVSCRGNSCTGNATFETNSLPVFDAPCELGPNGEIPDDCTIWCAEKYPGIFLSLEEIQSQIDSICVPEIIGQIKEEIIREGDICSPQGETITVIHSAKFVLHDMLQTREILRQKAIQLPIDLGSDQIDQMLVFPKDLYLNCDESDKPEEIYKTSSDYGVAYPFFLDIHNLVPDSIYRCDTFIIEKILGLKDTTIATDTIDGKQIWEQITFIDKEYMDSIVCGILPVLNPDSTVVLTPNKVHIKSKLCNILASYDDVSFDACGSGVKIVRNWKIIDWCNDALEISQLQVIEVSDTEKPILIDTLSDITLKIDPWACSANLKIPDILAEDNCSEISYEFLPSEGIVKEGYITDLWPNQSPIDVMVLTSDDCDNIDTSHFMIEIIDDIAPVAICNVSVQISLTGRSDEIDGGVAKLMASDFDEGSHDSGCGKVDIYVVRKEDWTDQLVNCDGAFIGYQPKSCFAKTEIIDLGDKKNKGCTYDGKNNRPLVTKPAEFVKFCCEDAGKLVTVLFIVMDKHGNTNICEAIVEVENNKAPELVCTDEVISCDDDMLKVPGPELIDGEVCPVGVFPIEIAAETADYTNCDTIIVTRDWYVDANLDGEFNEGEAFCSQQLYVIEGDATFELDCTDDINIDCSDDIDAVAPPEIIGNKFCVCSDQLVKLSMQRVGQIGCTQDTVYKDWYLDLNDDNAIDDNEPICTQRILISKADVDYEIMCEDIVIACDEDINDFAAPSVVSLSDNCTCPNSLKIASDIRGGSNCFNGTLDRTWYVDINFNNFLDDDEVSCVQRVTIDYSQVSFDLSCTNVTINCDDNPDEVNGPSVLRFGECECDDPISYMLEESLVENPCGIDQLTRSWFLDVDGNGVISEGEPTCQQLINIRNVGTEIAIICEDVEIECDADIRSVALPTIDNQNTCGCTDVQLQLSSQSQTGDLCFGDIITRSWYIDLNGDNMPSTEEPFCTQSLTIAFPTIDPLDQNNDVSFNCTTQTVSCVEDIGDVAAPTLTTNNGGICDCSGISVLLFNQSSLNNLCAGDTIFREWYADLNANQMIDEGEPSCTQTLLISPTIEIELTCDRRSINCVQDLNSVPAPGFDIDGFCTCSDYQIRMSNQSTTEGLCVGDIITRDWYLDTNNNSLLDPGEQSCQQIIDIVNASSQLSFDCAQVEVSCDVDLSSLQPGIVSGAGICSCEGELNIRMLDLPSDDARCFGDTIVQRWYIDVNNDNMPDTSEPVCNQQVIFSQANQFSLSCEDYAIACDQDMTLDNIPQIIGSGACVCSEINVLLADEYGAELRCAGDTLIRQWFGDINNNEQLDEGEPSCNQRITLTLPEQEPVIQCADISINCSSTLDSIPIPALSANNACLCLEGQLDYVDNISIPNLCIGDSFTRNWFLDQNDDGVPQENETSCIQNITVENQANDLQIICESIDIGCAESIEDIPAPMLDEVGICNCQGVSAILVSTDNIDASCVGDTITRRWFFDFDLDGVIGDSDPRCDQQIIISIADDLQLNCTDYTIACSDSLTMINIPTLNSDESCMCDDVDILIHSETDDASRCMGNSIDREWYADVNGNQMLDEGEPTCQQRIFLEDTASTVELICEPITISCQTAVDSIPIPIVNVIGGCGCDEYNPIMISDGSNAGICFGETFVRSWYIDLNGDGVPQTDEPFCNQSISVEGSMSDMSLSCMPINISCSDTLANIDPPEINAEGICSCTQVDVELAGIQIDGAICLGDTILQTWYIDINNNGEFDDSENSCNQQLIISDTLAGQFICEDVTISCTENIEDLDPPNVATTGLCSCVNAPPILNQVSPVSDTICIGDIYTREYFLDSNGDGLLTDGEPVCTQNIEVIGEENTFIFDCDTIMVDCMSDMVNIGAPTILSANDCVCEDFEVLQSTDFDFSLLCSGDTILVEYYGDLNGNMNFDEAEPSCNQTVIVTGSESTFDPMSIKWPRFFTLGSSRGIKLTCENGELQEEQSVVLLDSAFTCMPLEFESLPAWCDTDCGLVTMSVVKDTLFTANTCLQLQNTFTIIDWCTYDPAVVDTLEDDNDNFEIVYDIAQGDCLDCPDAAIIADSIYFRYSEVELDGVYRFTQQIDVFDQDAPEFVAIEDTVRVDVSMIDPDNPCSASVDVTAEGRDMCDGRETTPDLLVWSIRVVDEERNNVVPEGGQPVERRTGAMATINSRIGMPGDTFSIIFTLRDPCNTVAVRETQVIFFDSTSGCDSGQGGSSGLISGIIRTELDENIEDAMVSLNGHQPEYPHQMMTSQTGEYAFYNNAMHHNYELSVDKKDNYRNGVSTADLILIYNHIARSDYLDSPYKVIAADANADKSVSATDIVALKRLIIGIADKIDNSSWKFINQQHRFFNEMAPWPFIEQISLVDLAHDMHNENFIGIKIGDVNNDAVVNTIQKLEKRSSDRILFFVKDKKVKAGEEVYVTFTSEKEMDIKGFQASIQMNDKISYSAIMPEKINLTEDDLLLQEDRLNISVVLSEESTWSSELFTLRIKVKEAGQLSDMISLTDEWFSSEAYYGPEIEPIPLELQFIESQDLSNALHQNYPNPFLNTTQIDFEIEQSQLVNFSFYNIDQKLIYTHNAHYNAGKNSLTISKSDLQSTGLILYQMTLNSGLYTQQMLVIK